MEKVVSICLSVDLIKINRSRLPIANCWHGKAGVHSDAFDCRGARLKTIDSVLLGVTISTEEVLKFDKFACRLIIFDADWLRGAQCLILWHHFWGGMPSTFALCSFLFNSLRPVETNARVEFSLLRLKAQISLKWSSFSSKSKCPSETLVVGNGNWSTWTKLVWFKVGSSCFLLRIWHNRGYLWSSAWLRSAVEWLDTLLNKKSLADCSFPSDWSWSISWVVEDGLALLTK